jgi:hypothetical protein
MKIIFPHSRCGKYVQNRWKSKFKVRINLKRIRD